MEERDDSGKLASLSNTVDQGLKEKFDRAAAGSEYSKKTLIRLSANAWHQRCGLGAHRPLHTVVEGY